MFQKEIKIDTLTKLIDKLFESLDSKHLVNKTIFRAKNEDDINLLDKLEGNSIIWQKNYDSNETYELHIWTLYLLYEKNEDVKSFFTKSEKIYDYIRQYYVEFQNKDLNINEIIEQTRQCLVLVRMFIKYFDFLFSSKPANLFLNNKFTVKVSESVLKNKSYSELLDDIKKNSLNNFNKLNKKDNTFFCYTKPLLRNRIKNKVFIVHGHDEVLKNDVANFLKKLDLTPIILHEQANKGKTIIEKLEYYTDVDYAIILYTPCDLGGRTENNLNFRARQNVVFEHGFLMSKLGRENISVIKKDNIELPNDITGTVYVNGRYDWQSELIKELKSSSFNIDANKIY